MAELNHKVHEQIQKLCKQGDNAFEREDFSQAGQLYESAFRLVPQPYNEWEAATWTLTSMGECCFMLRKYEKAVQIFNAALHCPGGLGNPFIHLKLGESQLELNNIDRARDELARAYMGGGEEIFQDEDPKYIEFIKSHLRT